MRYAVLGDHDDGPTLRLDWQAFSYAGKFVMSNTGKAIAYDGAPVEDRPGWPPDAREVEEPIEDVVAAVSFNEDRTDSGTAWLRYVTVHENHRGEQVGARLCSFTAERLLEEYDQVRIAVNNPFAYEALHKAGFGYTGETTGIAELVLERPSEDRERAYQVGLDEYRERDLSDVERQFLEEKKRVSPPARIDP